MMEQVETHVTFQFRNTYPEIKAGKDANFVDPIGSRHQDQMKLSLKNREWK